MRAVKVILGSGAIAFVGALVIGSYFAFAMTLGKPPMPVDLVIGQVLTFAGIAFITGLFMGAVIAADLH